MNINLSVEFSRPPHFLLFFDDDHITLAKREMVVFLGQPRVDGLDQRPRRSHVALLFTTCNGKLLPDHSWVYTALLKGK